MKKRNFISLLLASPLLTLFKKKESESWWKESNEPTVITVEYLQKLSTWALEHGIKPIKCLTTGKEYYLWKAPKNNAYRKLMV